MTREQCWVRRPSGWSVLHGNMGHAVGYESNHCVLSLGGEGEQDRGHSRRCNGGRCAPRRRGLNVETRATTMITMITTTTTTRMTTTRMTTTTTMMTRMTTTRLIGELQLTPTRGFNALPTPVPRKMAIPHSCCLSPPTRTESVTYAISTLKTFSWTSNKLCPQRG